MLFTKGRLIETARDEVGVGSAVLKAVASKVLREAAAKATATDTFDIFLSHARLDADIVFAVGRALERHGCSVYVDWLDDPELDRSDVTATTAEVLRERIAQCNGLVYVASENSPSSAWMPWELGYADGFGRKVAIFPIVERDEDEYKGVEYLGLYPYVDLFRQEGTQKNILWVNQPRSRKLYAPFVEWLRGKVQIRERTPW